MGLFLVFNGPGLQYIHTTAFAGPGQGFTTAPVVKYECDCVMCQDCATADIVRMCSKRGA